MFLIKKTVQTMLLTSYSEAGADVAGELQYWLHGRYSAGLRVCSCETGFIKHQLQRQNEAFFANDRKTRNGSLFEKLQNSTDG